MPSEPVSKGFQSVRKQLDEMGYYQPLVIDALPLVEALLRDLLLSNQKLRSSNQRVESRENANAITEDPSKASKKKGSYTVKHTSIEAEFSSKKLSRLEKKAGDLHLLNTQAVSIIRNLQQESLEKSKRILELETAGKKGTVVTRVGGHHRGPPAAEGARPRIELTSLTRPSGLRQSAVAGGASGVEGLSADQLDVLAMYEHRNKQLDEELVRLQKKLAEAQSLLATLEKELSGSGHASGLGSGLGSTQLRSRDRDNNSEEKVRNSAYVLQLLEENDSLRQRLSAADRAARQACPVHGRDRLHVVTPTTCCCHAHVHSHACGSDARQLHHVKSAEDIRSAVQQSHSEMYQRDVRNQEKRKAVIHSKERQSYNQLEKFSEIDDIAQKLRKDNRELTLRVDELSAIRETQRQKIEELNKQLGILLRNQTPEYHKVQELIGYIERQRDAYKRSVESLLYKLDPDHKRKLNESLLQAQLEAGDRSPERTKNANVVTLQSRKSDETEQSAKSLQDIQNRSKKLLQELEEAHERQRRERQDREVSTEENNDDDYVADAYRSNSLSATQTEDRNAGLEAELTSLRTKLFQLGKEKADAERRFASDMAKQRQEIARLEQDVANERLKVQRLEEQEKSQVGPIESASSSEQLQSQIKELESKIARLESELSTKKIQFDRASAENGVVNSRLEENALLLENSKRVQSEAESRAARIDADARVQELKLRQTQAEVERLRERLQEVETEARGVQSRQGAERDVAVELRTENNRLRDLVTDHERDAKTYEAQIADLKRHVQKYVNEVKRIEELFTARDRERSEILEQYRHLSIEVDNAESYGRRMEAQVDSLQIELAARNAEMAAAQKRLADMEKDLVDLGLANESYRAQVATLGSRVDLAQSELRVAHNASPWVSADASNVQHMAQELSRQKCDLQSQLRDQVEEIESLTSEIRLLRQEVAQLSDEIRREREKSRDLEERMTFGSRGRRPEDASLR